MAPLDASMSLSVGTLFVDTFMLFLASIFVGLRFWARWTKRTRLQVNDYTIIVAWIFAVALIATMNTAVVQGGLGQPNADVSLKEAVVARKCFVAISVLGYPTVSFSKISAVDLFIKIFPSRRFHFAGYIAIAILALYCTAIVITTLAECEPFAYNWDKTIPGGHCIDVTTFYTATTSLGVALDFMVVILPMPVLWNLQMQTRKKLVLTVLFSLGFLICVISIGRAVVNANQGWLLNDYSDWAGTTVILASAEACLSIIVVCIPLLQPVGTAMSITLKSLLSRRGRSSRSQTTTSHHHPPDGGKKFLPFAGSEDTKFRRLQDHLFPISKSGASMPYTAGGNTMSDVEALGRRDSQSTELQELNPNRAEPVIAVTKGYQVTSTGNS